ncbi:MAG: DUF4349 domain-containing protein [Lachnospiraceae bacterium]|nr:DUF4349 domain-containing protein [Lachnospiraceae bacterium]
MKKKSLVVLLAGMLLLTACGSNGYEMSKSAASTAAYSKAEAADYGFYTEESGMVASNDSYSAGTGLPQEERLNDTSRKRIVTYNLSAETEDFDGLIASLEERVNAFGGYFESIDTYNGSKYNGYRESRRTDITIRVPAKRADEFVKFVGDSANITNKSLSSEDVTLTYVDLQSRKKTYETEMERLLALLDKASKVEDIITIEERLSNVRYELESMESQIRTYDNLVDYTAIYLHVSEVREYSAPEPETYGQRLGNAFVAGWRGFVDWLQDATIAIAETLPAWIILAIVIVVVVVIIKSRKKKGSKSNGKVKPVIQNPNTNKEQENNGQ